MDLCVSVRKLALQFITGGDGAGHGGLGVGKGGAGLGGRGGLGLGGLLGEIGGGDGRWLIDGALFRKTDGRGLVVTTGGSVCRGFLLQYLDDG